MKKTILYQFLIVIIIAFAIIPASLCAQKKSKGNLAGKPLFRDPVYDGAADPNVIWNREEKKWFMFYTNRRANAPGLNGVTWVHGTLIGIAESDEGERKNRNRE